MASLGAPSPLAGAGPGGALDGCHKELLPGNAGGIPPSTLFCLAEDGFQQMSSEFCERDLFLCFANELLLLS